MQTSGRCCLFSASQLQHQSLCQHDMSNWFWSKALQLNTLRLKFCDCLQVHTSVNSCCSQSHQWAILRFSLKAMLQQKYVVKIILRCVMTINKYTTFIIHNTLTFTYHNHNASQKSNLRCMTWRRQTTYKWWRPCSSGSCPKFIYKITLVWSCLTSSIRIRTSLCTII